MRELETIASLSQLYGADPKYVFLGGGNTSLKTDDELFIKPSGTALATIQPDDFLRLNRAALRRVFTDDLPEDVAARESAVQHLMALAVRPFGAGRASVEAPLHELIPYRFIVHLHPAWVNGMTCATDGEAVCARLFPDALWMPYTDPGFTLAVAFEKFLDKLGDRPVPNLIFLQNHGVFVGADDGDSIKNLIAQMMKTLATAYSNAGIATELATASPDAKWIQSNAPELRGGLKNSGTVATVRAAAEVFEVAAGPLTPDHVVYAKSFPLDLDSGDATAFTEARGYTPKVAFSSGNAVFTVDTDPKAAEKTLVAARDGALVQHLTQAFGGPKYLVEKEYGFIEKWEAESYRKSVMAGGASGNRLKNKVCVVTGAAQGFGLGIAEGLLAEGAVVGLADLNLEGAETAATELGVRFGQGRAFAVQVDVSNEASVENMMRTVVELCGGLDLFISNAGVLKAGSVKELELKDWDFVTKVNYTGYFLCAKHAAKVMAAQNAAAGPKNWTDIVQVSSKSGLEGSNRNGAYAGSKFGGIGLTQSFAKELVDDRIKVNSLCPGNFFEGPLWSDPERGLFVQYLRTGKVPGAKTLEDVKRFYESKVPMGRGCLPSDVVQAVLYTVEQTYETGQAIPVTGGQVMLN